LKQALEKLLLVDVDALYDPIRYNGRRASVLPWPARSE
jgi:hypothetical protein